MSSRSKLQKIAQSLRKEEAAFLPEIVHFVRSEFPLYRDVTDAEIHESLEQNIEMCIRASLTTEGNSDAHFRHWAQIASHRFEKGVPMEEIFQTYRFSIELICNKLIKQMEQYAFSASVQTDAITRVWQSANAYTVVLAQEYKRHQATRNSQYQTLSVALFEAINTSNRFDTTAKHAIEFFKLSDRVAYQGFVAQSPQGSNLPTHQILQMIEPRLTNGRGLCVATAHTVEGFTSANLNVSGISISLGPPRNLSDIKTSLENARMISRTSTAYAPGTHNVEDVGWRVAVTSHPEVAMAYEEKYLTPLYHSPSDPQTLLITIASYIHADRDIYSAAQKLHCHPNTLRYRLARFEQLTNSNLDHSDTLVELSWLLESREANPS